MVRLLFLLLIPGCLVGSGPAFWPNCTLSWIENEQWATKSAFEVRTSDDYERINNYLFSQKLILHAAEHLDVAANFTLQDFWSSYGGEYLTQNRVEFELNPHWKWGDLGFYVRNRLELRKTEGENSRNVRYRQRWAVKYDRFFLEEEIFYDWDLKKWMESRFVPLGVKFKLRDSVSLSLLYMLRSKRLGTSSSFDNEHVIGARLGINCS